MFNFTRNDDGSSIRIPHKYQDIRMLQLRHNPYVGSFHSTHRQDVTTRSRATYEDRIVDSKSGNVPLIRHAPSTAPLYYNPKGVGLKGLFHSVQAPPMGLGLAVDLGVASPMLSQSALSRIKALEKTKHLSLAALKKIPIIIFQNEEEGLATGGEKRVRGYDYDDNDNETAPSCPICLEVYTDGDELRALACTHCFHKKCIDIWLLGYLSLGAVDTSRCPQCRQEVCVDSEGGTNNNNYDSLILDSDTPTASFIRIGQSLSSSNDNDNDNDNDESSSNNEASLLSINSLRSSAVSVSVSTTINSLSHIDGRGRSTLVSGGLSSDNLDNLISEEGEGPPSDNDNDTILVGEDACLCGSAYSFCGLEITLRKSSAGNL